MLRDQTKVKTYWNEQWKKIETKAPTKKSNYYISNHGRVKSVQKENGLERLLKSTKLKSGYLQQNIRLQNNVTEGFYIQRLVAQYYIEKDSEDQSFVIHIDGKKENNHYKNLKWLNRAELNDRWSTLEVYKKINPLNKNIKLTESKVKLIKQRLKRGKTKKRIIARQFNISVTQLNRIEQGENWGHVKLEEC